MTPTHFPVASATRAFLDVESPWGSKVVAYSGLLGKILHRPMSSVDKKVVGLVERFGDGPGSGPEPQVWAGIEAWMETRVEVGTPSEPWAANGKAVEIL